jgi:hypothetical protein
MQPGVRAVPILLRVLLLPIGVALFGVLAVFYALEYIRPMRSASL